MKRLFFLMAALFCVIWALGSFLLGAGAFIHLFLIVAAICYMHAIIINPRPRQLVD